jgi:L-Ala-D/L-Glu epimerase
VGIGSKFCAVKITSERIDLVKIHPLAISRGTMFGSTNVVVSVVHDDLDAHKGIVGLGEMAPSDGTDDTSESAEAAVAAVAEWNLSLAALMPTEFQRVEQILGPVGRQGSAMRAALDMACWDWMGKRAELAVWQLLGTDRNRIVPTSLTIGMDSLEAIRAKVPEILARTGARVLKVKLGSPEGFEADQEMVVAAQEAATAAGFRPSWRVDANGGWHALVAQEMIPWLADRGVTCVEQPLAEGDEDALVGLYRNSELPIFADESIHNAADVACFADRIHGVNVKLMKCGGLSGALPIIHTARAHGLAVMIGCMGESSLGISAGAALGGLADHVDLDSHLNLRDDPFEGAALVDGRVVPNDLPGLGVVRRVAGC